MVSRDARELPTGFLGGQWANTGSASGSIERTLTRVLYFGESYAPLPSAAGMEAWAISSDRNVATLKVAGDSRTLIGLRRGGGRSGELINRVAERLVFLTKVLHDHGRRLGLLAPPGLLFIRPTTPIESARVVLLDFGFYWPPGHLVKPSWVTVAEQSPWRPLWGDAVALDRRVQGRVEEIDERDDLKLLARLFRWMIDGGRPEAPLSDAGRPGALTTRALLRDVECGRISSALELHERLQDSPLSQTLGPSSTWRTRFLPPALTCGTLVLAAAGARLSWSLAPAPGAAHILSPTVPAEPAWDAAIEDYHQAGANPELQLTALRELRARASEGRREVIALRRQSLTRLGEHFAQSLDLHAAQLIERLHGADAETALPQIQKLLDAYREAQQLRQELHHEWPPPKESEPWEARLVSIRDQYRLQ
jgi:hypothetical protein